MRAKRAWRIPVPQLVRIYCRAEAENDLLADDMEFFDLGTIFFLVAAVVIFYQCATCSAVARVRNVRRSTPIPPPAPAKRNRRAIMFVPLPKRPEAAARCS